VSERHGSGEGLWLLYPAENNNHGALYCSTLQRALSLLPSTVALPNSELCVSSFLYSSYGKIQFTRMSASDKRLFVGRHSRIFHVSMGVASVVGRTDALLAALDTGMYLQQGVRALYFRCLPLYRRLAAAAGFRTCCAWRGTGGAGGAFFLAFWGRATLA